MQLKSLTHRVIDTHQEIKGKDCLECINTEPAVYTSTKIRIVFTDKSIVVLCQYHYLRFIRMRRNY